MLHAGDLERDRPLRSSCHRGMRNAFMGTKRTSDQKVREGFSQKMGHQRKSKGHPSLTAGVERQAKEENESP